MYLLGPTSGGHVNPAVTWALFLDRRISIVRTVLYIIAQFVGGFTGAGFFSMFLSLLLTVRKIINTRSENFEQ